MLRDLRWVVLLALSSCTTAHSRDESPDFPRDARLSLVAAMQEHVAKRPRA